MKIEMATGAKKSPQFLRKLLLTLDPLVITRRRELHHALMPERRTGVNGEQLPQLIELENALAGVLNGTGRAHRFCFYRTGVICIRLCSMVFDLQCTNTENSLGVCRR